MRGEFYHLDDDKGVVRQLAPGLVARLFAGEHAMLSIVTVEPMAEGVLHQHPEEQWGMVLAGGGVRVQDGVEVAVGVGDFWRTPGETPHTFRAGPAGAKLLDMFSPPRRDYLIQPG